METLTGRTIGHYAVEGRLGAGGMGIVYQASDLRLGRRVALKVLQPGRFVGSDRKRRFAQEARAASALNHPNIVTIYDIGEENGLDFIAMELVAGRTLGEVIAGGGLEPVRALRVAVSLADALVAAHRAGLVHRDLKPSNVMVAEDGRVKVLDFGLAKLSDPAAAAAETTEALTHAGTILGTAAYMSPEQAAGRVVDARSDIFSFGAVLYEMLTGRRAFDGESSVEVLAAVVRDTPPPVPGVPAPLACLVARCLQKAPVERYQSAAELKAAIETCLAGEAMADELSIAVLPFADMSAGKDDTYLCEGLAEEIINALTRVPGLRVVARTSAFAVGRLALDVREIGARLGVGTVLEGSVRSAGNRVRVAAQLVKTSDGTHVWSERYERELSDIFALEDEIAECIAAKLRGDLARHPRSGARRPVDTAAYHAYLEGRYYFARGTPEALARARASYERAIALDPEFALAFDSMAELYWFLGFFGVVPPREAFSLSTWHVVRALELDDSLAEAHALLGMLRKELDYNWPEVHRECARALELNPGSPQVRLRHAISSLMPPGRIAEAEAEVRAVVESDPLSIFMRWWLAVTLLFGRRPDAASDEARRMIELDATHFLGHWVLGMSLDLASRCDEAVASLERAHELSGGSALTLAFLGCAYGRAGRKADARTMIEQAGRLAAGGYCAPAIFAFTYAGLADWDRAFEWMDRAIEGRDPLIMPIKSYHFLDPARSDPRFDTLLRKMNLA